MQSNHFKKAGLLTLVLVIVFTICWEWYWRNKGFPASFNDDAALWALYRKEVYKPSEKTTVFIGSSRIKFDLDIATWKNLTGEDAIQLALVGTNPVPLLKDLADDENFKGKLVVSVTEALFFSLMPYTEKSAKEGIDFYKKITPSQKFSAFLNHGLESKLVILEENKFGLNALFTDLRIPNRPGVFSEPPFPKEFGLTMANRQDYMLDKFLRDSALINWQTGIWAGFGMTDTTHKGVEGPPLQEILAAVKTSVDKIRARGGQVIFVRPPDSGPAKMASSITHPRAKYWNVLLEYSKTAGIHFEDDPETAGFICPEWSHLNSADAIVYTKALVKHLQEKNWFNKK
jgi:hypothetical protein